MLTKIRQKQRKFQNTLFNQHALLEFVISIAFSLAVYTTRVLQIPHVCKSLVKSAFCCF